MLRLHGGRMKLEPGLSLAGLAGQTAGFTGADLAGLCRQAALSALGRAAEGCVPSIGQADFELALTQQKEGRKWQKM